jgi:hypothetical protein
VASVPSLDRANRNNNDSYWSGITGILAIHLVVLFAVFIAALVYVDWSSNAAVSEFMAAGKPPASDRSHFPQSSVPIQQAKGQTVCARRG